MDTKPVKSSTSWQLQEAKQKFSEMVRRTLEDGPQMVTRHGQEVVVMISGEEYRRLTEVTEDRPDFKEFLMGAPDFGELEINRDKSLLREARLDV
jgi:prevent-host-death family protein